MNQENTIEIIQDTKSKKEYIIRKDIHKYLYPYFIRLRTFNYSRETNANVSINNIDEYLSNLGHFEIDLQPPQSEDTVITNIRNELLYISKDKYNLYFKNLIIKLSRFYDQYIEKLRFLYDENIEKAKHLNSIELIYSLLEGIVKLAHQENINISQIIEKENLEYLFIGCEIDSKQLMQSENGFSLLSDDIEGNSHHPLLTNPLTMNEQITLLQHFKIIDYLRDTYNFNNNQLSILISAIINKSCKNVNTAISFINTKESAAHKQKNKDTLNRILSKIYSPLKK